MAHLILVSGTPAWSLWYCGLVSAVRAGSLFQTVDSANWLKLILGYWGWDSDFVSK